jgi:hypothetical protein
VPQAAERSRWCEAGGEVRRHEPLSVYLLAIPAARGGAKTSHAQARIFANPGRWLAEDLNDPTDTAPDHPRRSAASAAAAAPATEDYCDDAVGAAFQPSYVTFDGWGRFFNCVGTVECFMTPDALYYNPYTESWNTIAVGPEEFGACNGLRSDVRIDCSLSQANKYQTAGHGIVYFDGGGVADFTDYSPEVTQGVVC